MPSNTTAKSNTPTTTSTKASNPSSSSFIAAHHPEKPSARAQETVGRNWTTSIAIPSSIVLNAQTQELRGWLVGQIARTCAIFSVTEIVVYKDVAQAQPTFKPRGKYRETAPEEGEEEEHPATFLARILEYLETPQYLRKALFPLHPSLRLAGLLPPLDCPHHLRRDDTSPFREGVIVSLGGSSDERPNKRKKTEGGDEGRVMVDIGLWDNVEASGGEGLPVGTRVTVRSPAEGSVIGELVPPTTPTLVSGLYWGYQVRLAESLACVFSESPFASEGGYDISIGTSERGVPIEEILPELPSFKHLLLTLGPLSGLELTIAADPLIPLQAEDASDLFDYWINVVEGQGSRTVRTEEALPIALARLKTTIEKMGQA